MKQLSDYIIVMPDVLRKDLIEAIYHEYIFSNEWIPATVKKGVDTSIRKCSIIGISFDSIIEKNKLTRKIIDAEIHTCTKKIIAKYQGVFPNLAIETDSGYDMLKYETGGFYTTHTDSYKTVPRAVSCSLILNDDYEGGEFAFFNRELTYKLKKGSCIVFPSNFMYPHEIMPVTSGTRYSIITWFV